MEKEGLVRAIRFMESHNLSIDLLVTDRHRQIDKWLRTEKKLSHTNMMCGMWQNVREFNMIST